MNRVEHRPIERILFEGQALLVIGVTRHKYWKGIVDGMPVRRDDAPGKFPDTHDERFAAGLGIAVEDFDVP